MNAPRTLMVMAGGTGGHIMPGLAVAGALRARGWNVVWMGNPDAMEGRLVPPQGIPMAPVRFSGVRGKGLATLLKLPFTLARAAAQALSALRRYRPDVVLGMGGYVALLVVHEQNSVAGMTNRVLARWASKVLTAFPGALPGELTGNPVRPEVAAVAPPAERFAGHAGPLRLLVVGGSLGAQALNGTVPAALAMLPADARPQVVHQAGEKHIEELRTAYARAGVDADCRAFIADMASAYAEADLVICRSGAMTVAEVCAAGVAALFVPFPHAVDDHQTTNARYLSDAQAGWLQPQSALTAEWLADWLRQRTRAELAETATRARALAHPLATERIADICEAAARR